MIEWIKSLKDREYFEEVVFLLAVLIILAAWKNGLESLMD